MKCSESWLRQWVNPKINRDKLCHELTMAGFEVEEILSAKDLGSTEAGHVLDLSITPNRGDCLSMRGVAREISAITRSTFKTPKLSKIKPGCKDKLPITIKAKTACPRYIGRVIRGVNANAKIPAWLSNRLLTAGVNPISPIVDVTNYVMLELGQPMHAFDLAKIDNEVIVRLSRKGESIALLDGTEKKLDAETLVIADRKKPLAIAGVMGGMGSCVTLNTTDILLESAYFSAPVIARQRQYYGLNTDSSYRFERGVDPTIQTEAIERATQLIIEISGGKAGPITDIQSKSHLPKPQRITLADTKIEAILGIAIATKHINAIFKALNFKFKRTGNKWLVEVPAYRFDLTIPEDLVEEIARLYGYDKLPVRDITATLGMTNTGFAAPNRDRVRELMSDLGYHEIISYSFVDKALQVLLEPEKLPLALANPITADMTVMRTNLWPGLLNALQYNSSRQQSRIRLFETGTCFYHLKEKLQQENRLAGILTGISQQEQWGVASRDTDFFDLKGDLEALLQDRGLEECSFKPTQHPALHPGQSAAIFYQDKPIGIAGLLHPEIRQKLDLSGNIYLFELDGTALLKAKHPSFEEISKFPEIRRDIAILVKETIPSDNIQATIRKAAGGWLKDVFIFDVYQGKGVTPGCKSLALALVLQHPNRTLVDEEAIALIERVITALKGQFGAELRS